MQPSTQFLYDTSGNPIFAVLPIESYRVLIEKSGSDAITSPSLLSIDRTRIELPHGGPNAHINLIQLADFIERRGIVDMAINQRAQGYDKFPHDQLNSLDPFIRRAFLPQNSPYKNTMQATTAVVDALVESGLFRRIKRSYSEYYRPVNAIEVDKDKLSAYLAEMGRPKQPLSMTLFVD